jgi:hypothetical protein
MKIKDLIKHLQTYDENDTVASSIWLAEDVLSIAHELGKQISRQQANEALKFIERQQDATDRRSAPMAWVGGIKLLDLYLMNCKEL